MSYRSLVFSFGALLLCWPAIVGAQQLVPLGYQTTESSDALVHEAYLIVSADTYTPPLYKGRAEPTANNPMTISVVAASVNESNLSYQWRVGQNSFRTETPNLTVIAPDQDKVLVSVSVLSQNNAVLAQATEYITISDPLVVFYENNPLRAKSRISIIDEYTLIGDEATIFAEPYFIGNITNTVVRWSIDGTQVTTTNPFQLTIIRPDEPKSTVPVKFTTYNTSRLSERINDGFNLNFGL